MFAVFPPDQVWNLTAHILKGRKNPKILALCCWLEPAPQKQRIQATVSVSLEAYIKNGACIPHVLHHRESHSRR